MHEKESINTNQFVWMLFILITSISSIHASGLLIEQAGRDAWLSCIGAWFLDTVLALIYTYMGLRFPGLNFVQYSITILGKTIGKIVGILFPLFFLLVCALKTRGLAQLLNIYFFPSTPLIIFVISSLFIASYAAHQGIEVIARVTELLGPLYILSIIIVILLVYPAAELDRLKPQFDHGIYPFLIGSPFLLSYLGICIMMAMFIPICDHPENGFLAKFISVSMGTVFLTAIVVFSIAVFGYEQCLDFQYTGLELNRMISAGRFLERMEIIWMMITTGAGIIASAIMIWAFCLGLSQIAGLSTYKPLVYPTALLASMLAIIPFNNNLEFVSYLQYAYPIIFLFVGIGLEIILFIAALLLNKRGKIEE